MPINKNYKVSNENHIIIIEQSCDNETKITK